MNDEQKKELIERAEVAFDNDKDMVNWITALVSGEYEQTTGALMKDDGFCCIGVAARVVLKKRERDIHTPDGSTEGEERVHIADTYKTMSDLCRKWGVYSEDYIEANDNGYDFYRIARDIVVDREKCVERKKLREMS
jgi:hypothetical protein